MFLYLRRIFVVYSMFYVNLELVYNRFVKTDKFAFYYFYFSRMVEVIILILFVLLCIGWYFQKPEFTDGFDDGFKYDQ